jgi:hypothetical protein
MTLYQNKYQYDLSTIIPEISGTWNNNSKLVKLVGIKASAQQYNLISNYNSTIYCQLSKHCTSLSSRELQQRRLVYLTFLFVIFHCSLVKNVFGLKSTDYNSIIAFCK